MNRNTLKVAGLLLATTSIAVYAQQPPRGQGGPAETEGAPPPQGVQQQIGPGGGGGPGPAGEGRPSREEIMKRFDTDGDGVLSDTEREAMRAAMPPRRGGPRGERPSREEMTKRFDTDGDGVLNEEERAAMQASIDARRAERQQRRQEMLKRFDADGDGQLSDAERQTMRETLRAEQPAPPPKEGAEEQDETGEDATE